MNIDWMLLTYLIIGFSAVVGFFRGWWKEAITMSVLAVLMILLQQPDWGQAVIDFLNWVIATIREFAVGLFGLSLIGEPFQFDATSAETWIMILLFLLGLSALIARLVLPGDNTRKKGKYYLVEPIGRVMGVVLGAVNGFLLINLVREYLDGRALPGNTPPETEITLAGASYFGPASPTLSIQAVNLPSFTILDSYIPWLVIGIGLLITFTALHNRVRMVKSKDGAGRKIEFIPPYGYMGMAKKLPPPPDKQAPVKVEVMNP